MINSIDSSTGSGSTDYSRAIVKKIPKLLFCDMDRILLVPYVIKRN